MNDPVQHYYHLTVDQEAIDRGSSHILMGVLSLSKEAPTEWMQRRSGLSLGTYRNGPLTQVTHHKPSTVQTFVNGIDQGLMVANRRVNITEIMPCSTSAALMKKCI